MSVDFILPPGKIAEKLTQITQHTYISYTQVEKAAALLPNGGDELNKIFVLVRSSTTIDFSYYMTFGGILFILHLNENNSGFPLYFRLFLRNVLI